MTEAEFEHMISAYGANPARWPAETAQSAQSFMSKFPKEAETILSKEAKLDGALDLILAPAPSDLLKKRIQNAALMPPANENSPAPKTGLLKWKSVAALMLGAFALGFGGANWMPSVGASDETLIAQTDTNWEETADDLGLLEAYSWVEDTSNL